MFKCPFQCKYSFAFISKKITGANKVLLVLIHWRLFQCHTVIMD